MHARQAAVQTKRAYLARPAADAHSHFGAQFLLFHEPREIGRANEKSGLSLWTRFTASCEVAWLSPSRGARSTSQVSELEFAHSAVLSTDGRALLASLAASHRAWPGLRLVDPSLFSISGYSVLCGLPWLLLLSFWRIVDVAGTHFLRRAGPSHNQNHPFVTLTLHGKTLSAVWLLAS